MPVAAYVDLSPYIEHLSAGRTLLTPGLRLARQLRQAWFERQSVGVCTAPSIAPVDAWLELRWREAIEAGALPPARMLSRLEERLLWLRVVEADLAVDGTFRLLQVSAAADQAMASRQAIQFHANDPARLVASAFKDADTDCAAFQRWLAAFEAALVANRWVTRADAYRALLKHPGNGNHHVVLCHCGDLPPLTLEVLRAQATVSFIGAEQTDAQPALVGRCYVDRRAELQAVARWAAERHREGQGSTGVVLLDMKRDRPEFEYWLRDAFDCLDRSYARLPVNFSTGMPLVETPMFRDALLALRLDTTALTRAQMLRLLRSPYVLSDGFAESHEGLRLIQAVTDLSVESIDSSDFKFLLKRHAPESALAQVVNQLDALAATRMRQEPCDWVDQLRARLELWQWPARRALDSLEYQQLERLERSFDDLAALSELHGEVSYAEALSLWAEVLRELVFQPETDAQAVQVMGPREAVGLSFDALWICGAQADALPRSARLLPFLPASLQRTLRLPNASNEALFEADRHMLNSWLATHRSVRGSSHHLQDGIEQMPSRFLLVESEGLEPGYSSPRWASLAEVEAVSDDYAPAGGELTPYGGGAAVLKDQASCPMRAWFNHRLRPAVVSDVSFGLTALERGSLVHWALEHLWRALGGKLTAVTDQDAHDEPIRAAAESAMNALEAAAVRRHGSVRKRVGSACLALERERLQALLSAWLALEAERTQAFKIQEQEEEHKLTIGALNLQLRPDRIDELADGRRLVIDYKTGSTRIGDWLGERPQDPQLPIYALLDERVAGIAFASVRQSGDSGPSFSALGDDLGLPGCSDVLSKQLSRYAQDIDDWAQLRTLWRERLERLADEYAQGFAQPTPSPSACRHCPYDSVCRVAVDESDVETSDQREGQS